MALATPRNFIRYSRPLLTRARPSAAFTLTTTPLHSQSGRIRQEDCRLSPQSKHFATRAQSCCLTQETWYMFAAQQG